LPSDHDVVVSQLKADIELLSQRLTSSEKQLSTMACEKDEFQTEVSRGSNFGETVCGFKLISYFLIIK
jgi:chaperonin cofactor prefoldin